MLTKTHFVLGQRCHKALHFKTFPPNLIGQSSALELKTKQEGVEVGTYARTFYPDGVLIDAKEISVALKDTQRAIAEGTLTLFEAAFFFDNVVIRADIMTRKSVNAPWDLYEVKATTYKSKNEAKKEGLLQDVTIQVWVIQQSGIKLGGAYLTYLNSDCIYPNLDSLFISDDYLEEIAPLLVEIPAELAQLKKITQQEALPNVPIGPHCEKNHDCAYKDTCWRHLPQPSVFDIPNCRKKWKLAEEGRIAIQQLSESDFQSATHLRVLKCYQEDQPYFDKQMAQDLLQHWQYPLSYFDIEAISYPIPRYLNTRPYQDLPFQFSCHIQQHAGDTLDHYAFLYDRRDDPRQAFIKKMLETLPQSGSIVVYHQTYEISKFKELARNFPEYAHAISELIPRVVDLKKVIMDSVYYPAFLGSFSIKKVAPVLLGKEASYQHLEVSNGIEATLSYEAMINLAPEAPEREKIRNQLLEYCQQDTLLMVHLHHWLCRSIH